MHAARCLPVILLIAAACTEPHSVEQYCVRPPYSFEFDFADTLTAYDISFYTAPGIGKGKLAGSVRLSLVWISPDGATHPETVYLPLDGKMTVFPYRSGISVPQSGKWRLDVSGSAATPSSARQPLNGLGVILSDNNRNGTR